MGHDPMHATSVDDPLGTSSRGPEFQIREEFAFRDGLRAWATGFPWVFMATLRYLWTNVPQDPVNVPYAPLNRFWHMRQFADASLADGAQPINDTPYSIAWLDLAAEPVILSHRDMGRRQFAFDLVGMGLERFASIGGRETGPAAGAFAIRGPDWRGTLPPGIVLLPRAASNSVLLVGRTEACGVADLPALHDAQDGYGLVPLDCCPDAPLPPESRAVLVPVPPPADPLGDWKTMNSAMTADPPRLAGAAIEGWAHLGIGPGLQVETQPEPVLRGLARAAAHALRRLEERATRDERPVIAGWTMLPLPSDASRHVSEYSRWQIAATGARGWRRGSRAAAPVVPSQDRHAYAQTALGRVGLETVASLACDPSHAPVEFSASTDEDGAPLVGGRCYRLRFPADRLPPARYSWAVTLYGTDGNLVSTASGRSSLGSRDQGFVLDPDGGATIVIRSSPPSDSVNWLPAPAERQSFYLVLRLYAGDRAAIGATWWPPAVRSEEGPPAQPR